ncbi:MAG: twin-arginine translocation signal domain-containing protein [Proteobacteria bacterium]|nr:twin-arginine translocation signal domain-containing protein [Pseudomonadota bacterium]
MNERQFQWMIGQVKSGRMSRREFVGRAGALGVGVAAATTMLSSAGVAEEPVNGGTLRVGTEYSGPDETFTRHG